MGGVVVVGDHLEVGGQPGVLLGGRPGEPELGGADADDAAQPAHGDVQHVVVRGVDGAKPDPEGAQGEQARQRAVAVFRAGEKGETIDIILVVFFHTSV